MDGARGFRSPSSLRVRSVSACLDGDVGELSGGERKNGKKKRKRKSAKNLNRSETKTMGEHQTKPTTLRRFRLRDACALILSPLSYLSFFLLLLLLSTSLNCHRRRRAPPTCRDDEHHDRAMDRRKTSAAGVEDRTFVSHLI